MKLIKQSSPSKLRSSAAGIAVAACTLAAIPAAMAGGYQAPYYDPVRDVMVTPPIPPTRTTVPAGADVSSTYRAPEYTVITRPVEQPATPQYRQPIYGTYYAPAGPSPVSSSPGAVGSETRAAVVTGSNEAYYDSARDVMVTPSLSGTRPYVGSSTGYGQANAAPASTFEFVVRNGRLIQGPTAITVDHGSQVTMIVDSDSTDALRVDGYNLVAPVVAGQPMLLTFLAEQPGRFSYRLGSGREIGVIEVGPASPRTSVGLR